MTVIAMTREIGSLGADVAIGIADRLGLKIIHSEIVANQLAERLGVDQRAIRRYVDGSASMLERWMINRRKLHRYTTEEILRLVQEDNVLIRGWGAAVLLQQIPQVISVRICAPMAFRVRTMMDRLGTGDAATVHEEIERFDAAHTRTLRESFGVDREDPLHYHLVLNTDRLGIDDCVAAVCQLAQSPRFRNDDATRTTLANKLTEARINSALAEELDTSLAPAGVSVSAANGSITIAGTSSSGKLRKTVERIAASIAHDYRIENKIISVPTRGGGF
jgi:cytidylate kinase